MTQTSCSCCLQVGNVFGEFLSLNFITFMATPDTVVGVVCFILRE
jgi:hypothetical protein